MRPRRGRRFAKPVLGLVAYLSLMLASAEAAPAVIFDLSSDPRAEQPAVAGDETGTAHVAWNLSAGVPGDDQLVYCRVPSGAKSCALTHTVALPLTDFDGPQVVLTRSGAIVLVSSRCCFPAAPGYAAPSTDGGQSFGPPVVIAEEFAGGQDWEAVLGPGDFSLALSGGNSGPDFAAIWRAAPLDGSSREAKAELAPFPKAYFTSTRFTDPNSPPAPHTHHEHILMRRWGGAGDYNAPASWTPEAYVVNGDEPKLASGLRGVYLIYRGAKRPFQYLVRRLDG